MIIDPTAHLPQKIKKKEENEDSVNIDFDLPPQTAKLHSLAKVFTFLITTVLSHRTFILKM